MGKKISECAGARVHASFNKKADKIAWRVNYKTEGVWCNSEEELLAVLKKISLVQIHGEDFRTWILGKDGWNKNADYKED